MMKERNELDVEIVLLETKASLVDIVGLSSLEWPEAMQILLLAIAEIDAEQAEFEDFNEYWENTDFN
jgi:hypothetical protein